MSDLRHPFKLTMLTGHMGDPASKGIAAEPYLRMSYWPTSVRERIKSRAVRDEGQMPFLGSDPREITFTAFFDAKVQREIDLLLPTSVTLFHQVMSTNGKLIIGGPTVERGTQAPTLTPEQIPTGHAAPWEEIYRERAEVAGTAISMEAAERARATEVRFFSRGNPIADMLLWLDTACDLIQDPYLNYTAHPLLRLTWLRSSTFVCVLETYSCDILQMSEDGFPVLATIDIKLREVMAEEAYSYFGQIDSLYAAQQSEAEKRKKAPDADALMGTLSEVDRSGQFQTAETFGAVMGYPQSYVAAQTRAK